MVSIKKSSKLPSVFYVFFQLGLDKDEVFPIFKKSTFLILIQKKTYKIKLNIYFFVSNTFWLDYNWQIFLDFVLCSTLESWFPMIFYMMFHLKFDFIVSYATPMSWNFRKKINYFNFHTPNWILQYCTNWHSKCLKYFMVSSNEIEFN